jgi:Rrf2 family iron-sulfur cluster assembly transcriptional regulator
MKLVPTRRTDYGIRALLYLAHRYPKPGKAAEIGEEMDIPIGFLHQVLQELQRARLVISRPGRTGGYALARPPETVTIRAIVEALEGPLEAQECALRGGPCYWDDVCALHWVWSGAQHALIKALDAATLAQVAEDDQAISEGKAAIPANSHRKRRGAGDVTSKQKKAAGATR